MRDASRRQKYLQISFLLFTDLFCEFESSFCQWKLSGNEEGYSWFRNTSKSLKNLGISGPKSDNFNQTETYFVMTSNYLEEDSTQAKAYLLSRIFKGSEQPVGCFKFLYNFGVSIWLAVLPTFGIILSTMLQKLSKCEVKSWLCWNLTILPSLRFYVKSNFGKFKRFKNVIFGNYRGS